MPQTALSQRECTESPSPINKASIEPRTSSCTWNPIWSMRLRSARPVSEPGHHFVLLEKTSQWTRQVNTTHINNRGVTNDVCLGRRWVLTVSCAMTIPLFIVFVHCYPHGLLRTRVIRVVGIKNEGEMAFAEHHRGTSSPSAGVPGMILACRKFHRMLMSCIVHLGGQS